MAVVAVAAAVTALGGRAISQPATNGRQALPGPDGRSTAGGVLLPPGTAPPVAARAADTPVPARPRATVPSVPSHRTAASPSGHRVVIGEIVGSAGASASGPGREAAGPATAAAVLLCSHRVARPAQSVGGFVIPLTVAEGDGAHTFGVAGTESSMDGYLTVEFFGSNAACNPAGRPTAAHALSRPADAGSIPRGARWAVVVLNSHVAVGVSYAGPPFGPVWVYPAAGLRQAFVFEVNPERAEAVQCDVAGRAHLTPGTTSVPSSHDVTLTASLRGCSADPRGGTASGSLRQFSGTCIPQVDTPITGTVEIRWDDGSTSTLAVSVVVVTAYSASVSGTVTGGRYVGRPVAAELMLFDRDAYDCVTDPIDEVTFAGQVSFGSAR